MKPWLVTGTGTGVGKTRVTAALARAAVGRVLAVKPVETGVTDGDGSDATALAGALGQAAKGHSVPHSTFVRMRAPLAPYAATLEGEPPIDVPGLVVALRNAIAGVDIALIEGAGGLLVPLDAHHTIADLAVALGAALIVVAPDRLGVLSDTLTTVESAERRNLDVAAVVLNRYGPDDPSRRTNHEILQRRLGCHVEHFAAISDPKTEIAEGRRLWRALTRTQPVP